MGGDGRDLPRVVRLDAADRNEPVASLRQRVGGEVLELPDLVAAEREACVAVLPLRPDLDPATEVLGEPVERVYRRWAEEQGDAIEVGESDVPVSPGEPGSCERSGTRCAGAA
jgi:hypothetical protein